MASKNDRGKRSSSKSTRRREEQLDLFPHHLKLTPPDSPLGGAGRAVRRNDTSRQRAPAGSPVCLVLL